MTNGTALTTVDSKPLTAHEMQAYEKCCQVIDAGLKTFVEVGEALITLREGKLYRARFPGKTWDEFLDAKWGFTRQRANQLMSASTLAKTLGTTVDIPNERIARELSDLQKDFQNPELVRLTLTIACATAPNGKITSEWVASTGAVLQDAMGIKGLNAKAISAEITHEAYARMIEKQAALSGKRSKPVANFIVDGNSLKLITSNGDDDKIADAESYRVVVYAIPTVKEGKS
jgi:hypothetical protein